MEIRLTLVNTTRKNVSSARYPRNRPTTISKRSTGLVRTVWMVCVLMSPGILKLDRSSAMNVSSSVIQNDMTPICRLR